MAVPVIFFNGVGWIDQSYTVNPESVGVLAGRLCRLAAIVFGIAPILFTAQPAGAQQTVTSATLSGLVQDLSGASVTDAVLTATSLETNQKQLATTDLDGRYRFRWA
jgi:hypothetical protein